MIKSALLKSLYNEAYSSSQQLSFSISAMPSVSLQRHCLLVLGCQIPDIVKGKKNTHFAAGTLPLEGRSGWESRRHHESTQLLGMGHRCLKAETGSQKREARGYRTNFQLLHHLPDGFFLLPNVNKVIEFKYGSYH